MDGTTQGRSTTLAHISRWKCGLGAIPVLALGIIPNLPGFGDGLVRSAFFYAAPFGIGVRFIACGALILLGLILLLSVLLTLTTSSKAVWVDDDNLKWGRIGTKHMPLAEIRAVSFDASLNRIRLERRNNGKPEYIPTLALRSADAPDQLVEKLRHLIQAN
jgi:hypothetical protein